MNSPHSTQKDTITKTLENIVTDAFLQAGFDTVYATVTRSKLPEKADYQSNTAFSFGKVIGRAPMEIAEAVALQLQTCDVFKQVSVATPGFINLVLSDDFLTSSVSNLFVDGAFDAMKSKEPKKIILDFGGANVAKPLHVGHLRSAIIGESLKRIGRFFGNEVIGDVHLGDWGLQMGMVITELKREHPEWSYFDRHFEGRYPSESPITIQDLERIYPQASARAKADESVMQEARTATVELQNGRRGYRALWKHFLDVSIADLALDYGALGVEFDLWLGESDAHNEAVSLLATLHERGLAYESEGALVMDVKRKEDVKEIPPLMLQNSDGAMLYGATDLATLKQRMETYCPHAVLYVVDKRQALHLRQVFRASESAGITSGDTQLEHIGFGTMNGTDNKPFKTRDGGTMKLKDLIALIEKTALNRITEIQHEKKFTTEEQADIARKVGSATLKFADLSNHYAHDYVFDIERFSSFEGYTGPYLLYSAVRAGAILEKAGVRGDALIAPTHEAERKVLLELLAFPRNLTLAWEERAPSILVDHTYSIATAFNTFYHECPVLKENDERIRFSRISLVRMVHVALSTSLSLLGIEVPKRM